MDSSIIFWIFRFNSENKCYWTLAIAWHYTIWLFRGIFHGILANYWAEIWGDFAEETPIMQQTPEAKDISRESLNCPAQNKTKAHIQTNP